MRAGYGSRRALAIVDNVNDRVPVCDAKESAPNYRSAAKLGRVLSDWDVAKHLQIRFTPKGGALLYYIFPNIKY